MARESVDRQISLQIGMLAESALNDTGFDSIERLASQIIAHENPLSFGALLEFGQVWEVHGAESNHPDGTRVRSGQVFPRSIVGRVFRVNIKGLTYLEPGAFHPFLESLVAIDQYPQS